MAAGRSEFYQHNVGRHLHEVIEELEARISFLEKYIEWDAELRKQNPALQDLYEKFQATKNLIGPC